MTFSLSPRVRGLSDAGFANVVQSSSALKELFLDEGFGRGLLTDTSLESLRSSCPSLERLTVDGCGGISGRGIGHGCANLTRFQCFAAQINAAGLRAVCIGCPNLTELNLYSLALEQPSELEVIGFCQMLRDLEIRSGTFTMSDAAVTFLLRK